MFNVTLKCIFTLFAALYHGHQPCHQRDHGHPNPLLASSNLTQLTLLDLRHHQLTRAVHLRDFTLFLSVCLAHVKLRLPRHKNRRSLSSIIFSGACSSALVDFQLLFRSTSLRMQLLGTSHALLTTDQA